MVDKCFEHDWNYGMGHPDILPRLLKKETEQIKVK